MITRGRLKGVGVLSARRCRRVGRLRSRGAWQRRELGPAQASTPYSVYPRLEFDVVVGENGDAYDRDRVPSRRVLRDLPRSSISASNRCPGGPVKAEGLPRLIAPPPGDAYDHIESARGSLGVYLVSDGVTAAVSHERALACLLQPRRSSASSRPATRFSDLVVVLGSLDPVFGEVDR